MVATSKNVLFPDHNHLLTAGTGPQVIVSVGSSLPVVMTWKWNIFRSGLHGAYLVDSGFFCVMLVIYKQVKVSVQSRYPCDYTCSSDLTSPGSGYTAACSY